MSLSRAIRAAADDWAGILARLDAAGLAELLRLLRAAVGPEEHGTDKVRLVAFLARWLPADHPVRRAAAGPAQPATVELADEVLLAGLEHQLSGMLADSPEDVAAAVRARLLGVPAYGPGEVGRLGHDPGSELLIRLGGRFPTFQFGADGALPEAVLRVNRILRAEHDPWGAADWWLSQNAWLGRVPARLLGEGRDDDLVAAAIAAGAD